MYKRRNFLKKFGLGIGLLVSSAQGISAATPTKQKKTIKIGLLKSFKPCFSQLEEGFYQFNKSHEKFHFELITENIEDGNTELVRKKIQKLSTQNKVDFLVGTINSKVLERLNSEIDKQKIPFILLGLGENHNRFSSDLIYTFDYDLCKLHHDLGKWSVKRFGKKALISTGIFDSGFDALESFISGVESEGGEVVLRHIDSNDFREENSHDANLATEIQKVEVDFCFAFHSGKASESFIANYTNLDTSLPLVLSPFMFQSERNKHFLFQTKNTYILDYQEIFGVDKQLAINERNDDPFAILSYNLAKKIIANTTCSISNDRNFNFKPSKSSVFPIHKMNEGKKSKTDFMTYSERNFLEYNISNTENLKSGWLNPYPLS